MNASIRRAEALSSALASRGVGIAGTGRAREMCVKPKGGAEICLVESKKQGGNIDLAMVAKALLRASESPF